MALPVPCLMLVTDRRLCGGATGLVAAVEAATAGGVDAVQLREKDIAAEELLPLALRLRDAIGGRALLIVNGSVQVALAAGADGGHLPEDAPPVERPREGFLVGRSVHSLEAGRRAEGEGVDYVIAGPAYDTASHPAGEPVGVSLIGEMGGALSVPVLAIGGVSVDRVGEVVAAGASGVAVISAVLGADDCEKAARRLRGAVDAAWLAGGPERG